ncbi:hypothetical protein NLU13_8220 [Sarocladium strictum]|uniref:GIT Spa2 homology (SHD) domain-containing protein n=1 Tax=Sarocladium strictum TaxID=5046 RepID=A0AA39GBQ8_SARSR|nr:hypothetical protein NLU13_8220 [Sarocladium strictum]
MSVNGRNAPLSPVSLGGSEWSVSKYPEDGPYPNGRGNLASPPNSGGSNSVMSINGFPTGARSNGGPSPPPSIGRMSNGSNLYARSESGRNSTRGDIDDGMLLEHYIALRAFLNTRDPNSKQPPNKARDKLLRLSSVQFYELSTDVYDELIRRQAAARAPPNAPNAPPAFLLPKDAFHPKRNQARQRLSSLGPPRFRDLAADVFHELERRFPRFVGGDIPRGGSSMSMRGPPGPGGPSRTGTPVNGGNYPPRGQSRRPSNASSMRGPPSADPYAIPPSPGLPNGEFGRPMQKQLNQNNTIVPNKSTMLEEDEGDVEGEDAFGLEPGSANRGSKTSGGSETDKKLIEDYQSQVQELREKLDGMEDAMKKKDDEMSSVLDGERSRATAANMEKQEWSDMRLDLENKLAEAQNLNDSMKQELQRVREDHDIEVQQLRSQLAEAQQAPAISGTRDEELRRENEELREELRHQQQIIEEVRGQAQDSLREMRILSQQSSSTYDKQVEMEKTIEQLEHEVREWKNRFARAKTQLRHMQTSSMAIALEQDASKLIREKGFLDDNGLIKDVHVTKFQIAIDELLQKARRESPETVTDAMKSVVVSVRSITRDLDEATPQSHDLQQQGKLKARVSSTANGLITATRNFAASAGISPVSIIDAAASNLTAAVIELLRFVKIRSTPAGELEEEDGTVTPAESTGFFSPLATSHAANDSLPPPPPFQGLGGMRASAGSSAYSPISSPRESVEPYARGMSNGMPNGYGALSKDLPPNGYGMQDSRAAEDLKIYLEDQTALLVSDIQTLVGSIRGDADIQEISAQISSINAVVGKIVARAQTTGHGGMVTRLSECRERLLESNDTGRDLAQNGTQPGDRDWKMWSQTLPPIAFEIARETKELVQHVGQLTGADDFS